jgi:F0F1-type ATP synthase assembly protein I
MSEIKPGRSNSLNTILIVLVGQMGCLAVIVVAISVLAGLWLDSTFHTKPIFTLILLLAGVPVSVLLMLFVARRSLAKLKIQNDNKGESSSD